MVQASPVLRDPEPDPDPTEVDESRRGKRKRKSAFDETAFVVEMPGKKRRRKEEPVSKPVRTGSSYSKMSGSQDLNGTSADGDVSMSESENRDRSITSNLASTPVAGSVLGLSATGKRARPGRPRKPVLIMPEIVPARQLEETASESQQPEVKLSHQDVPDVDRVSMTDEAHQSTTNDDGGDDGGESAKPEVDYSASFLEDEFLNDAMSSCGDDPGVAGFEPIPTTPVIVRKRGRPKKSTVIASQPPTPTAAQLSNSWFATPTELPRKRGRKKKSDTLGTPQTDPDSSPGKRNRKRINYLELAGDIDPNASTDFETGLSGSETPSSSTPKTSKRGRKPKIRVGDVKPPPEVVCGKCESTFKTRQLFFIHAANAHGGIVSSIDFKSLAYIQLQFIEPR